MFQGSLVPFLCIAILGLAHALELKGTQEGSCSAIRKIPTEDVDPVWLDKLPYVIAGNRFHFYRQASVHPRFRDMRDFEFYYDACFVKNTSLIEGNGSMFGFGGRVLGSFDVEVSHDPTALVDAYPNNPQTGPRSDFFRQRVTLTDHRTFAVMVHCWVGADQKSWNVYSLMPKLDANTEKRIQDHIAGLGFKRENFIFLRYDSCKNLEVPLSTRSRHGSGYPSKQGQGGHRSGSIASGHQGVNLPGSKHWDHETGNQGSYAGKRPGTGHSGQRPTSSAPGSIKLRLPSSGPPTFRNVFDSRTIAQVDESGGSYSKTSGSRPPASSGPGWSAP